MTSKNLTAQFGDILKPLKVILHGPPAAGKTDIAKRICQRYGAHYVSVKSMIDETLEDLRQNICVAREQALLKSSGTPRDTGSDEDIDEEEEEENEGDPMIDIQEEIERYEEQIRDINSLISSSPNQKLPDDYVVRLMRIFLMKSQCQSHGYVLDGFPKTIQQAKELFGQAAEVPRESGEAKSTVEAEEAAGEGGVDNLGDMMGNASVDIMPDFLISLQADDEFLCERVMKLPQREIQGTHYDEPNMIRRLIDFRNNNTPDNTVLTFFDEVEIHPIVLDITEEGLEDIECILAFLYKMFGPPIPGIGLTDEEEEQLRKMETEQRRLKQEAYLIEKQLAENTARQDYEDKMEKWAETLEKLQMEEEKIIAAESEPLRFYLMKFVFPTLTRGLSEVAKIKPDDPIDYLAEFLFKENPEGRMFDPSYTRTGEELLKQYETVVQNI
ncbi:adenylate kinase 7 [Dendroctonus ponderosae]|nr:adenylate kinase 7 [Dendroctonus ponderosae]KAH1015540.1 hypothetical protein HUJ05_013249 [Dendroctonus ponderosae]